MKNNNRLFLLDAFALIYRAYFAFSRNPLINSKGVNVSAITGFTSTLHDLLQREDPTHMAVVFDSPGPTDRAVEHSFYKANRQEMPEDIRISIPIIKQIVEAFHIPIIEAPGFEADDLIGTLARKAEKRGYKTFMVTPDKDFGQLVSEHTFMYKPGRSGGGPEVLGLPEILEKWQIERAEQVIDILGLWGDSVDNIPGIPGIGEKTAKKLIGLYGSVEGLIENVDQLKGKQQENVRNFAEQGLISKKLATIILDSPVEFEEDKLIIDDPDTETLSNIFRELEFRTLGKRILGESYELNNPERVQMNLFGEAVDDGKRASKTPVPDQSGKNIENTNHEYTLVSGPVQRAELVESLSSQSIFCFDTETTGVDPNKAELVGISFSWEAGKAFYVPVPSGMKAAKALLTEFKTPFENKQIAKIGQNIKYDILVMRWYGIEVEGDLHDTMIAHYLLEPDKRHKMDMLAESYLGYTPVPIEKIIGPKGRRQLTMRDIEPEKVCDYAAEDADITLQLESVLNPLVDEKGLRKLYSEVEIPLLRVLADLEYEGVALDSDFLLEYSKELSRDLEQIRTEIFTISDSNFNLDSPKQLGEILFGKMGLPYSGKKTKTGQFSTNEESMVKLSEHHEIADKVLAYREIGKLKSTYVDALPLLVNERTGRLHTTFSQTVAATGRLSSNNPNLQNIPIRTFRGREIRKAFIPRSKDHLILSADYSQVELRIIAAISGDENMTKAFMQKLDIHTATAALVFGVDAAEVDSDMRRKAKMVNFGIIYGISAYGLSQRLRIPRKEAAALIENYFTSYPKVRSFMDETIESARKKGYVETLLGRRRYLKDINSKNQTVRGHAERNAINSPIQGSAADLIKVAMINIQNEMKKRKYRSRMTLQVHDELVFDVHKSELDELRNMVIDKMENAIPFSVPIEVEAGNGKNWLEAH